MNNMISKFVRNVWTLTTLAYPFLLLLGFLNYPDSKLLGNVLSYNFILVSLYLYGNKSIKNVLPIVELWLGKKSDKVEIEKK